MKPVLFFLINSLESFRGGLTKATLTEASALAKHGYETYVLTFNNDPRYPIIRHELLSLGKVDPSVTILNLYEQLEGCNEPRVFSETPSKISIEESLGVIDQHGDKNAYRVFENGLYTKYKMFHDDGTLNFIDYFNESRYRVKREYYDFNGNIRKVTFMDYLLNKARQMIFYDENGRVYLSKWVNPENGLATRVIWFNQDGEIIESYNNDDQLKREWVERLIANIENPVLVSDARNTDKVMVTVKNPSAVKLWRLHSSHLSAPYEANSPIASTVEYGIQSLNKLDGALFLTNQQVGDIKKRFGARETIYHIPNITKEIEEPTNQKDQKLAVIVSRIGKIKNIHHIVKAFNIVVQKIPNARLEIWGSGAAEEEIKDLISDLNLSNNISLKGYTTKPGSIYQKALFSVSTSKTEGFGLSIIECMVNGTPMISYDIKYGPRDLINHGEDGIITPKGDVKSLANQMIYLFENPGIAEEMGKNARKKIQAEYNEEKFQELWVDVINKAIENKQRRIKGLSFKHELTQCDVRNHQIHLAGSLQVRINPNEETENARIKTFVYIKSETIDKLFPIDTQQLDNKLKFDILIDIEEFKNEQKLELFMDVSVYNFHKRESISTISLESKKKEQQVSSKAKGIFRKLFN